MQNFLYDEKEIAGKIFENGFTNGYDRRELLLYAKYLRHVLGYKDVKIKKKLIEFCSKSSLFNEVTERNHVITCVKNSRRNFFTRTSVFITKDEIDKVKKVKNFDAQKVYLALLLIAKRNRYNLVSIKLFAEIKRIAGVNCTTVELGSLFHQLYKGGLIYPTASEKNNSTIGYLKILDIDFEGKAEISITTDKDFYNLGKIYENYCGGYVLYCLECGLEFFRKNNRRMEKYCEKHSKEKSLAKYKRYNEKRK